ncbi:MAG: flavodoxin family protein [bacterium]
MTKILAINGSPHLDKGNTGTLLAPFVEGLRETGAEVELYYASRLRVKSCSCQDMYCWFKEPGICCIRDEMDSLYPKLKEAETLVFATPVHIPLPGDMQNLINRLCPLMLPKLEMREGRTRARLRENVNLRKFVLVATGGWWEIENFGTVVRIVEELAATSSVEFAGALLRPHSHLMKQKGEFTADGLSVLAAAKAAGRELIETGAFREETLSAISRPLISLEEVLRRRAAGQNYS